jgi:16S rRNA A1518/A1519 N6-dimethyltransferase RsmA/KsgA/DIM1 with predicted DNA glycosylase/AP lyase activity
VNENHAKLLGTAEWAAHLHEDILPAVTDGADLGDDLLEIGPGPGAASEWLRHRVRRLVALELDPAAAAALQSRFSGTNVEAVTGDDTYNPVEPAALLTRLQTIGFGEITITVGHTLLFRARKKAEDEPA